MSRAGQTATSPVEQSRRALSGAPKPLKRLLKDAIAQGAEVAKSKKQSHLKVDTPNGARIVVSYSASDSRAIKNIRADLRRIGNLSV